MTWLDSFDQKWNSPYYGNGLAGQFSEMESAPRFPVPSLAVVRTGKGWRHNEIF